MQKIKTLYDKEHETTNQEKLKYQNRTILKDYIGQSVFIKGEVVSIKENHKHGHKDKKIEYYVCIKHVKVRIGNHTFEFDHIWINAYEDNIDFFRNHYRKIIRANGQVYSYLQGYVNKNKNKYNSNVLWNAKYGVRNLNNLR